MNELITINNLYLYKLNKEDVFDYILIEMNKKYNLKETTIIMPSSGDDALSFANVICKNGYKALIVMSNDVDETILNDLNEFKIDIVLTPYALGFESVIDMANDIKLEIDNSLVLNLYEEKLNVSSYFKVIGPKIFNIINDFNYLLCPIDTGGAIVGLSKFFKMKSDCYTIGIKKKNNLSKILDDDLIDEIVEIDNLNYENIFEYAKGFMSNNIDEKALLIFGAKKLKNI